MRRLGSRLLQIRGGQVRSKSFFKTVSGGAAAPNNEETAEQNGGEEEGGALPS